MKRLLWQFTELYPGMEKINKKLCKKKEGYESRREKSGIICKGEFLLSMNNDNITELDAFFFK